MGVCVCVRARAFLRACACMCAGMRACVCVRVSACVCLCGIICVCVYLCNRELCPCVFSSDVGHHRSFRVADQETSRVDAVTVVDNTLRSELLSLSFEPQRHSEFVHFVVGKPRTKKGYLEIIFFLIIMFLLPLRCIIFIALNTLLLYVLLEMFFTSTCSK